MSLRRGALIVLEGCDKAGKSTQVELLVNALNNANVKTHAFRFPDRTTEIGKMIDAYLKCTKMLSDEAIHLLFSSNRWEVEPTIRSILAKGETIVVDRYAFSGVAFTAAKGTKSLDWCKSPDVGLPKPDLVCYLNLSEEAASRRGDFGGERYEKKEFQRKVHNAFMEIQEPAYWKIIDADKTTDELHHELFQLALECVRSVPDGELSIGKLWVK